MTGLRDKTVVVTGGGGGIGGATSRRFAAEGAGVAVLDLSLDAAEAVAAQIRA
ncbi:MAG TPA: SDR family NAD(P)-dependent oxidoreductase, partial [Burkholderiaceae bacterium]|nr:SDR family NAD(P)-dependent oxidoreductase [Burkholderiaceae bacterium]